MPSILEYTAYEAFINVTVSSLRPEGVPAHIIPNAKRHQEIASLIRWKALREYKHRLENGTWVPRAQQLNTYLPPVSGAPYYAVRKLQPAGSIIEVNEEFMLDILRLRFALVFVIQRAALSDDDTGGAFEQYFQKAIKDLFVTGYSLENVFIPDDETKRPEDGTQIDIMIEMGNGSAQQSFEIPSP